MTYPENLEKYRWDWQPDKCLNDYRLPGEKRNSYEGFASKEEEEEYWDKMGEMELDSIIW